MPTREAKNYRPEYAYEITVAAKAIRALFSIQQGLPLFRSRKKVLPGHVSPVVQMTLDGELTCVLRRWGLAPYRSNDTNFGSRRVTARAETLATAPAYRTAFKLRRCLIPATGFYSLIGRPNKRSLHRLLLPAGEVIAIAGLWDKWRDRWGENSETFTMIMANCDESSEAVQARLPVIIEREDFDAWLREPRTDLLKPFAGEIVVE